MQTLVKGFSELDERFNQQEVENNILRETLSTKKADLDEAEEKCRDLEYEVTKLRDALDSAGSAPQHDSKIDVEGASLQRVQSLEQLAFIPQNLSPAFLQNAGMSREASSTDAASEVERLKAQIAILERQVADIVQKREELERELCTAKQEQEQVWDQQQQDKVLDAEALACLERENDLLRAEAARLNKRLSESLDKQERSAAELQSELVLLMKERDQAHRQAEAERRAVAAQTRAWADAVADRVMQERLAFEQERGFSTFQRERVVQALHRLQAAVAALPHDDPPPRGGTAARLSGGVEPAAARLEERLELLEAQLSSERLQNEKLKQAIVRERTRPFAFDDDTAELGSASGTQATALFSGGGGVDGDAAEVARLREQLRAASQHIQNLTVPRASGGVVALPRPPTAGKGSPQVQVEGPHTGLSLF